MVAKHLHHIVCSFKALLFRRVSREVHPGALTPSAKRLGACAGLLLLAMLSTSPAFANPGAKQRQAKDVSVIPAEAQTKISGVLGRDRREYQSVAQPGGFTVENARHGVSAEFTSSGVAFHTGGNHWGMALLGFGYGDKLHTAKATAPASQSNRVEYRRGSLTEWYENGPLGLEQGFTLAHAPGKSKGQPLTLTLALSGDLAASVDSDGRGLTLKKGGTAVLRYSSLIASDARGRELDAWIELDHNQLSLLVNDASAMYPLTIDPLVQAAILTASDSVSNDFFGAAVGISGDGNTIVVGQWDAKIGSNALQGAAYVFAKPTSGWVAANEIAKLTASDGAAGDSLGFSVGVSNDGSTIVAGAVSAKVGSNASQGAAYAFVKPASGWVTANETAKLTASDGSTGDEFGYSAGVSSDGSTIVAGAVFAKVGSIASQGAAYVFAKLASGWTTANETAKLTASDGSTSDDFGSSVGISSDGSTIVAGAVAKIGSNGRTGAAYVFVRPGIGWSTTNETAKLTSFDGSSFTYAAQAFGNSVGVSGDGSTIAVGAPLTVDPGPPAQGSAYVFLKPSSGWATATQTAELLAFDGSPDEEFGLSLAISGDGSSIVVGTFGKKEVYVFGKPTAGWVTTFESSVKLTASGGAADLYFGYSVILSSDGDTIVAGTPNSASLGFGADQTLPGNAYVFTGSLSGSSQTSFSPASLSFSNQAVGTTSSPQSVTLTNSGGTPLNVTSIVASANFTSTQNCVSASPIAPGLGCSEDVTFAPGTGGPLTGALTFTDDSGGTAGATQLVPLSGTGTTPPTASPSPASLNFGSQIVGATSSPQTVTLTNIGGSPLHVSAVAASANFTSTQNCVSASPIAPGFGCSENVSFTPGSSGPLTGTLKFTDDSGGTAGTTQLVPLSGTGSTPPAASPSPASLNFGSQNVGTTSSPQTVTLTNTGGSPLHVSNVVASSASASFASTHNCANAPVAPGSSCSESVTFTPTSGGAQGGTLTFTDDTGGAAGTIQSVSLSGTGVVPPHASLTVTSINFGNQLVETDAPIHPVMLTNSGGSPLHITAVVFSANFFDLTSTDCVAASPLAPGGSCTEDVSFVPNSSGPFTGTLTFTDDSDGTAGATQSVSLSGTGVAVAISSFSPSSLNFGNQFVGTTSAAQTITVTNVGYAPLHVTAVTAPPAANFASTQHCVAASPIPPGGSCSESVTFTPTSGGAQGGMLTFTDDSGGTAGTIQPISLSGTGVVPPHASLPVTSLNFGSQIVNIQSPIQQVMLTNSGGSPLHITAVVFSTNFVDLTSTNCVAASPLAPGASCTEDVSFEPTSTGPLTGTLTFTDDSGGTAGATQSVSLSGTGVTPANASLSPMSLSFGSQVVGTTSSSPQTVTLTNTGGASLFVGTVAVTANFTAVGNCLAASPLASGSSCTENVSFAPGSTGALAGTLTFTDNGGNGTQKVSLNGTGVTPSNASLSPTGLNFGSQAVGTTSGPQTVSLTNTGGLPMHVTAVAASANFTSTHNCVSVSPLAAGASCSESVSFAPGSIAPFAGTLVFVDDSGGTNGATQLLALAGTGAKATTLTSVSAAPTTLLTGQQMTVSFSVIAQPGDTLTPTGIVSVAANTGENCSGPASSGTCVLTFATAGTRTVSATYSGDADFLPSTSTSVQVSVSNPTADLFVSQQPSLISVKSATDIAYTLTLKNSGPNAATSVTMTDPVPANSTFVSISAGAPCTAPGVGSVGTITCAWGSLANGASASVVITVEVDGSGNKTSITNTVTASAATLDPNLANNTATVTTQITGNKK